MTYQINDEEMDRAQAISETKLTIQQHCPEDYLAPDWDGKQGYRSNWHDYVPDDIRLIWESFTDDQKKVLASYFLGHYHASMVALL